MDSYAAHKHAAVKAWLAAKSRIHVHSPRKREVPPLRADLLAALSAILAEARTLTSRARPGVWRVVSHRGRWTLVDM